LAAAILLHDEVIEEMLFLFGEGNCLGMLVIEIT
jgi:hypothetical protein